MRGKKSRGSLEEREEVTWMVFKNSSGQMVMPMPASAMARVVMVFSVSRISLGLKKWRLKYWSTVLRVRLPRLMRMKGMCWKESMSAPEENCSRISPARSPKISSVKDLGTTIISVSSVRGTTSTPSIMMGWKQTIRSTRPWASSSSRWVELPSNRENSTMGNSAWNWGRISGRRARPQVWEMPTRSTPM